MAWWSSPTADPRWRPPRLNRPGGERLREQLGEILDDANGEPWFNALALQIPADAIGRFLDGQDVTPDETRAIVKFVSEFGYDMETGN